MKKYKALENCDRAWLIHYTSVNSISTRYWQVYPNMGMINILCVGGETTISTSDHGIHFEAQRLNLFRTRKEAKEEARERNLKIIKGLRNTIKNIQKSTG